MPPFDHLTWKESTPGRRSPAAVAALDCSTNVLIVDAPQAPPPPRSTDESRTRLSPADLSARLRPHLLDISRSIAFCGTFAHGHNAYLDVHGGHHARWANVHRCGSSAGCPECADRLVNRRAGTVTAALAASRERGCRVVHVTLTRRPAGLDITGELDATDGILARTMKKARGRRSTAGYVAGRDLNLSEFEAHPHTHLLLVVGPEHHHGQAAQTLIRSWLADVAAAGHHADDAAQHWRIVDPDNDYRVAFYVVSGAVRTGSGGRSQTVRDVQTEAAQGSESAVRCLRSYVAAMGNRDQVSAAGCLGRAISGPPRPTAADRDRVAGVEQEGYSELRRTRALDRIAHRVAAAVDGSARRLAVHADLLAALPYDCHGRRSWWVDWAGYEYEYHSCGPADAEDLAQGIEYHPPVECQPDPADGMFITVRLPDGSLDEMPWRAPPSSADDTDADWDEWCATVTAELKAERRRQQVERREARREEVVWLAQTGDIAGVRLLLRDIERYWQRRASRPETSAEDRRRFRLAEGAQVWSVRRTWSTEYRLAHGRTGPAFAV